MFDPRNIPAEFSQTSQLAEDQLTKLENSDQKVLGSESSTLNLLSSGLTSQTKVLNSLIDKLDSFQLKAGTDLGTDIQEQFDRHVTVTRKLQKSAIQTSLKDQGLLPDTANIQLICNLYTEETTSTNTVPETAIKNLHGFTGEGTSSDIDLKCEQFIDTALDIAISNKLSHIGCKNLILRKLSGYANLVLQTYLDNQAMTTTSLSLTQLLGFLEKTFRAQSTPEIALHRLQNLPEIRNKNYLQSTGVIARLSKLSCRNEKEESTRKLLFQTRAREYLLKSLQQDDRSLIQKEDQRRISENKEPLSFISISEYLTKFHQLKTKPAETFEVHQVNQNDEFEILPEEDPCDNVQEADHSYYITNNRYQHQKNRNDKGPRGAPGGPFRGAFRGPSRGNFRSPYQPKNSFSTPGRRPFYNKPFQGKNGASFSPARGNGFQRRGNQFSFKPYSNTIRANGNRRAMLRGRPPQTGRGNYRGGNTSKPIVNRGHQSNTNRTFVTPQMVNLEPSQCLLCGSRKHLFNSNLCCYWPQRPQSKPCSNHNPPKYGHLRETCLGDFTAHLTNEQPQDGNF